LTRSWRGKKIKKNTVGVDMQGPKRLRWFQLCQEVAVEQDHAKMLQLITEINDILEEKEKRLEVEQMIYESKKGTDAA
jgi:hypothetical protein